MLERLQKVLAGAGVASRREAEGLITAGRVTVDGRVITELGTKVDPEAARIAVDGREIASRVRKIYVLLNKPRGFVTTRADPHAPRTVMELVRPGLEARLGRGDPAVEGLHPVGRLDADTEGLLILTNDGAFTHALTHPRHEVPKTYVADVQGWPDRAVIGRLREGVSVAGRRTAPAEVRLLEAGQSSRGARLELCIHEGRKRQVRQMLQAVGHPVLHLARTRIGDVARGALKPGQWRFLTDTEILSLWSLSGAPE
jgi:23S rRNA pseudouridine2605 synthase